MADLTQRAAGYAKVGIVALAALFLPAHVGQSYAAETANTLDEQVRHAALDQCPKLLRLSSDKARAEALESENVSVVKTASGTMFILPSMGKSAVGIEVGPGFGVDPDGKYEEKDYCGVYFSAPEPLQTARLLQEHLKTIGFYDATRPQQWTVTYARRTKDILETVTFYLDPMPSLDGLPVGENSSVLGIIVDI